MCARETGARHRRQGQGALPYHRPTTGLPEGTLGYPELPYTVGFVSVSGRRKHVVTGAIIEHRPEQAD